MTVLDAYAVIALLRAEPAATAVQATLERGDAALTAVGAGEVLDHLIRLVGADEEEATLDVAQLGLLDAVAISAPLGAAGGRLRARHYHRTRCSISMADCLAAEAARALGEKLATCDPHLLNVCHIEGIDYVALPQSDGSVWSPSATA